jgi:hypothetical protein
MLRAGRSTAKATGKEVRTTNQWLEQRIAEAWALVRKGGHSAKIGRAFLNQHGVM